jgi:hypothetical protein
MPTVYIPPPKWDTFPKLKRSARFTSVADRAIVLKREMKEHESKIAKLKEELDALFEDKLEPELIAGGIKDNVVFDYEGVQIRIADQGSGERIDEQLLLQNGVARSVIDKSKVPNKRKHYLEMKFPDDPDATTETTSAKSKSKTKGSR